MNHPLNYFSPPRRRFKLKPIIAALLAVSTALSILIWRSRHRPTPTPILTPPVAATPPSSFFLIWHNYDFREAVENLAPTTQPSASQTPSIFWTTSKPTSYRADEQILDLNSN
jgi:hypothetical protein